MTVSSVTLLTYFLPITEAQKVFLSRKDSSETCSGFGLLGFPKLCNKEEIVHNPFSPYFLEKAVYALCVYEKSNFYYIFADSLSYKLNY